MQALDTVRPDAQPVIAGKAEPCGFGGPWRSGLDEREELRVAAAYRDIQKRGLRDYARNKLISALFARSGLNGPAFLRVVRRAA